MHWWYPYKVSGDYETPDSSRRPIQSQAKPEGNWWGPFHCEQCAIDCGSFGRTEKTAWLSNHGTDDERFCATLSIQ